MTHEDLRVMKKGMIVVLSVFGVLFAIGIAYFLYSSYSSRGQYERYVNTVCIGLADSELREGERSLTPTERTVFVSKCNQDILDALEPCIKEYGYGTDSSIQCYNRYGHPVFNEASELLSRMMRSPLPSVAESLAKAQTRSQEPQQEPSGSTPGVKSSASAREDTPSPLAAIAEGVTTAVGQAIQVWSTVPISWSARSSAANDAEQAADKAIRQLKALPKEQGTQAQRKAFIRSFGTFAKAMRVLSEGAASQDVESLQAATTMVLQAAKEMKGQ